MDHAPRVVPVENIITNEESWLQNLLVTCYPSVEQFFFIGQHFITVCDIDNKPSFLQSCAYEIYLQELLAVKYYLPGQEVVKHLVQRFPKMEPANARKIMQRAVENSFLKSSAPFTFGKGQYIYLSPLARLDKTTILSISNIYRPPLYRLLRLLEENSGILSYYEALKVTASPVEKTRIKCL